MPKSVMEYTIDTLPDIKSPGKWRVMGDGGAMTAGRSWGAAYAWKTWKPCGAEHMQRTRFVLPGAIYEESITSNNMELAAICEGVLVLPTEGDFVQILSDSKLALCWLADYWATDGIPNHLISLMVKARKVLSGWKSAEYVLLAGHPSPTDLKRGYKVKRGIKKDRPYPVSEHNVFLDAECNRVKALNAHLKPEDWE